MLGRTTMKFFFAVYDFFSLLTKYFFGLDEIFF